MKNMTAAQAHKMARYIRKVCVLGEIIDFDNQYTIQAIKPNVYAKSQDVLRYELKTSDVRIVLAPEQTLEVEFMSYQAEIMRLERQIESLKSLQSQLEKAVAELESEAK